MACDCKLLSLKIKISLNEPWFRAHFELQEKDHFLSQVVKFGFQLLIHINFNECLLHNIQYLRSLRRYYTYLYLCLQKNLLLRAPELAHAEKKYTNQEITFLLDARAWWTRGVLSKFNFKIAN